MDEVLKNYFEKIKKEGFPFKGELQGYDIKIEGDGCRGGGSADDIIFFIKREGEIIKDISYLCNYCIPPSYVVADVICRLAKGKTLAQLKSITPNDINEILGGDSPKIYDLAEGILKSLPE